MKKKKVFEHGGAGLISQHCGGRDRISETLCPTSLVESVNLKENQGKPVSKIKIIKNKVGASKMVQQVEAKPEDLSLSPGIHTLESEN